jgi:hypothetical protein
MKNMLRSALTAGVFALCTVAGLTAAKAEVLRIAVVVADNAADYANNAALAPTFAALLKKGNGVKDVYVGTDEAKMSIASSSVWDSEANAKAATSTDEWKATAGKLKFKTYTVEFLEVK